MASFYVFLRENRSPYYQVKFLDDDGRIVATRSTGEKKRDRALLAASEMAKSGILPIALQGAPAKAASLSDAQSFDQIARTLKASELTADQAQRLVAILAKRGLLTKSEGARVVFVDWLEDFWTWKVSKEGTDLQISEYIKERRALGHRITKGYADTNSRHVVNHYRTFFQDQLLGEVARADLKRFFFEDLESRSQRFLSEFHHERLQGRLGVGLPQRLGDPERCRGNASGENLEWRKRHPGE